MESLDFNRGVKMIKRIVLVSSQNQLDFTFIYGYNVDVFLWGIGLEYKMKWSNKFNAVDCNCCIRVYNGEAQLALVYSS